MVRGRASYQISFLILLSLLLASVADKRSLTQIRVPQAHTRHLDLRANMLILVLGDWHTL